MAYFDGLIETILAVGLVKPKQGMCEHLNSALILFLNFITFYLINVYELCFSSQGFYSHTFTTS